MKAELIKKQLLKDKAIQIIAPSELGGKENFFRAMLYSDEFNFLGCHVKIYSDSIGFIQCFKSLREFLDDNSSMEEEREYFIYTKEGLIFFKMELDDNSPWVFEMLEPFPTMEDDVVFGLTLYLFSQLENHFSQLETKYLFLHSGSVVKENKAILLVGESGAGKTTLTIGLLRKDFNYFSDEYAIIQPGTLKIKPFLVPPKIKAFVQAKLHILGSGRSKLTILFNNFWKVGYFDISSLCFNEIKSCHAEVKFIFFITRNSEFVKPIISSPPKYIAFKKLLDACRNRDNVLKSYKMVEHLAFILENVKFYDLTVGDADLAVQLICKLFDGQDGYGYDE